MSTLKTKISWWRNVVVINFKWKLIIIILKLEEMICKSQSTRILVIKRENWKKELFRSYMFPKDPNLKGGH